MEYIGIIESINQGDGFSNITVRLADRSVINIKTTVEQMETLAINQAYRFLTSMRVYHEKEQLVLEEANNVFAYYEAVKLVDILPSFYDCAPCDIKKAIIDIEEIIENIKNEKIKAITKDIYYSNKEKFIIYPAATKFHHAYVGGLIYHTYRMLIVANKVMDVYDYMNKDLVLSSIILHDMSKVREFSAPIYANYTPEGLMIGHIVMGVLEIEKAALRLNIGGEEVLLLKHILLSHHGIPEYGSPKKPMIPEAILVNQIDNMDSKLTVLGESFNECEKGEFTTSIGVVDRTRMYNKKI